MNSKNFKTFINNPTEKVYGTSILQVATQHFSVSADASIEAVAEDFSNAPDVCAVGVVNSQGKLISVIDRTFFFTELGKPFGRDVLIKKPVIEICHPTFAFYYNKNVFSVANDIKLTDQLADQVVFYGLTTGEGKFAGIFSSMDLLRYLSRITQQDIELAGKLQERLIKEKQTIEEKQFSFYGFSQFAKGMGGDFYGIYPIGPDKWFFTLCDVSGKGVAASVISSLLWGMLRIYDWKKGLKHLIIEINKAFIQTFHLEKYVTGVLGIYDAANQKVTIADMGHSMSYIVRGNTIKHIHGTHLNLPLGIDLDINPQTVSIMPQAGDVLIFMTDGLVEQENASGEMLPVDEWIKQLSSIINTDKDPRESILRLFDEFRRGIPQQDDLTALFLKIHP